MNNNHWLVCYDIENNRQRRRANRLLRQYSLDYQKSGFETLLAGDLSGTLAELHPQLSQQDRLLLARLHQPQPDWRLGKPSADSTNDWIIWA
tara:strand:- start:13712 stop:13987 length:276 start_codon:yes stop_codon:yes gene_type:complete